MRFVITPQQVDEARLKANDDTLSLASFIEECYGPVDLPEEVSAREGMYIRAFFNWFRLVHLIGGGHGYLLDKNQRRAYHMLLDWWTATYHDPKSCIMFLLSNLAPIIFRVNLLHDGDRSKFHFVPNISGRRSYTVIKKSEFEIQFWEEEKYSHSTVTELEQCVSHYLQFLGKRHDVIFETVLRLQVNEFRQDTLNPGEVSDYDRIMWRLFVSHFCANEAQGHSNADRQGLVAIGEAHYRDTEFLVMRNTELGKLPQLGDDSLKLYILKAPEVHLTPQNTTEDMEICVSEASNFEWPRILEQGLLAEVNPPLDRAGEAFSNWPQYLWHRADAKLVRAKDLVKADNLPAYTAISHTGYHKDPDRQDEEDREDEEDRGDEEDISYMVPNGWEFPVPLSERFDVENLPEDLKQLGEAIETEYVWMDLLCLPQCEENDEQDENGEHYLLKLTEISRQSAIFRSAARVIEWPQDS
jgi:hypothetical protein